VTDVLVLCYHAVSDRWPSLLAVTSEQFERQLVLLTRRGYRGTTFARAATSPPADRTLAVTFDDGYRSVFTHALPILERLGLPATVFVPTDFVDRDGPMSWPGIDEWVGGPYEEELVGMSWNELAALGKAGWEIGSHTCSHPHLSRVDDAALARELRESRRVCEQHLGSCSTLALPYGDGDERVARAAGKAGYEAVAGLNHRASARTGWPRVGVYPTDGPNRFRLKVARSVRRVQDSLARSRRVEARIDGTRPGRPRAEPR
jgi:peptidoglycan/xylan/chitin deacetylase (PgdA/CDA1 family)